MAVELVAGAALAALYRVALQDFYLVVKNAVNKARKFKTHLESLQSKLEILNEWVEQIRDLNEVVGHKEEETKNYIKLMKEGKELVRKCLKIGNWSRGKSKYVCKLSKLEEDIQKFIDFYVPLFQARNGLEILATVNKIYEGQNLGVRNGGLSCAVPPPPNFTVGLDVHIEELKRKLLNEKLSLLVLTAAGGCGKTTLVKKLCQDEEIKGIFKDNIFFILVSKTPNLKVIAHDLFDHKGYQVPEFQNDEDTINRMGMLLKQIEGPILLILDDVWSGSESFVNNFEFDIPNYHIVVTSRIAIKGDRFTYTLPPLNDEDAKTLLHHSAGLEVARSSNPNECMKKILKDCGGYPLALEVIGRSLCGQPLVAWQSWVSHGHSTLTSNSELLDCLKKSLDVLDDITKECFLDLGLFPKDQKIPVAALIDIWVELYKLDEDGMKAIEILHKISSHNLASLDLMRKDVIDIGKDYNEDFVSQHDLLRKLAIHQNSQGPIEQQKRLIVEASENNLPEWWSKQKQLSIKAHILSITIDEKFSSNWCDIQPSEVEILVLNLQTEKFTLPEFVTKMPKLKVIIVTNYGFSCVELSNLQLLEFAPCLRKIRLKNVSIPSSFMVNIRQTLRNHSTKSSNIFPNLMEINIDSCDYLVELPNQLCEIACLKKLSINRCDKLSTLPQRFGELRNLEVLSLTHCLHLLGLPESIKSLYMLRILDIFSCHKIKRLPEPIGELTNLEVLRLRSCYNLLELPESIRRLHKLRILDIFDCRKTISLPKNIGELKTLKVLRLWSCFSLLELPESIRSLHKLSILDISYCQSITKLPKHFGELSNLKEIHMEGCLRLHKPLRSSTFDLKQLELVTCDEKLAKSWEPIKKERANLHVKVVAKDGYKDNVFGGGGFLFKGKFLPFEEIAPRSLPPFLFLRARKRTSGD